MYLPKFLRNAEKIIDKFINLATRNAKRSITKSMRQLYGDDFAVNWNGKDIDDILRLIIRRNVGLIENTTLQTLNNIENIVYDGVTTGQTWGAVAKDLSTQKHISSDRIKRIARDQTGKANEALNEAAQLSAGIEFLNGERLKTNGFQPDMADINSWMGKFINGVMLNITPLLIHTDIEGCPMNV